MMSEREEQEPQNSKAQGAAASVDETMDSEKTSARPDASQAEESLQSGFEKTREDAYELKRESASKEELSVGREHSQEEESESESEKESEKEKGKLEEAQAEIEKLRESWSRERAEFMNYRKRMAQERQKQVADTVASFLQELLPVFDNLDQVLAMKVESEELKKYVAGVSMIRENFIQVLAKRSIKLIRPVNEEFDPQSMEAIATEEDAKFKKDTVLEVYQAGCLMEGEEGEKNLIRPARVRVGKASV